MCVDCIRRKIGVAATGLVLCSIAICVVTLNARLGSGPGGIFRRYAFVCMDLVAEREPMGGVKNIFVSNPPVYRRDKLPVPQPFHLGICQDLQQGFANSSLKEIDWNRPATFAGEDRRNSYGAN